MQILRPELLEIEKDPFAQQINDSLMISKNSQRETYSSVCNVATPAPTKTHMPIPNSALINLTADHIAKKGWVILATTYASSFEQGNAHFVFELENELFPGVRMQIAGHNSHIKMRSAILYMQTRTNACTNMDVPAQVPLKRKHTPRIMDELPFLIENALTELDERSKEHTSRLLSYQRTPVTNTTAHDLMIKSLRENIVPASYLPIVANEWHDPTITQFENRDLYSLYNCFTESFKKSPAETPDRTQALIKTFDDHVDTVINWEESNAIHQEELPF